MNIPGALSPNNYIIISITFQGDKLKTTANRTKQAKFMPRRYDYLPHLSDLLSKSDHSLSMQKADNLFCNCCPLVTVYERNNERDFRYKPRYVTVLATSIKRQLDIHQCNPQLLTKKGHSRTTPQEQRRLSCKRGCDEDAREKEGSGKSSVHC